MTREEETNERNACDEWWHAQPNKGASIQEAWVERARRAKEAEHQLLVRAADIAFDHLFTVHNAVEARALSKAIMALMIEQDASSVASKEEAK